MVSHNLITLNFRLYPIFAIGLLIGLTACTSATPSPTPTPTITPTPSPTVTPTATSTATATPTATETSTPTATHTPTSTPTPTPTSTPSVTTLRIWEGLPELQSEALAEDIEAFQDEFPQYEVILQHYDDAEAFIMALLANEVQFDVVLASPVLLGDLWQKRQVAPMSNFFPSKFIDSFAMATLAGARRNDEIWGLPDTAGFHLLLFYNRDLVEDPPATTLELFELAESLTQAGQWGLAVNSYDPLWLIPWLSPAGDWLTDERDRPTLDTSTMQAALELYLSWQQPEAGIAPIAVYNEVRAQFLAGNIAMVIDGDWAIGELARTRRVNWGVALLPSLDEAEVGQPAASLVLARYWAVQRSIKGNQALAAAAFLEHVTRPERQLDWTIRFGLLPARLEALDDPIIVNDSSLRISAEQMIAGRTMPLGTDADVLLEAMREPLRRLIEGELTPQQAAKMMQANAEK